MLKSSTSFSRRSRSAQVLLTATIVLVGLACAGIRTPFHRRARCHATPSRKKESSQSLRKLFAQTVRK
jgi:hypothetical protein